MPGTSQKVQIEVYSAQTDEIGEGPIWSVAEQALYWVDIGGKALYRKRAADSRARSWRLPDYPGCVAELTSGTIAVAMGDGVQRLDLRSGELGSICAAPPGRPGTRFNDGKVDPQGRLWVGTMQNNYGPKGEALAIERWDGVLYRFDPGCKVAAIEENIGISNTLAWSPDSRRFYFGDSMTGEISVYDFDAASGSARDKRSFFKITEHGIPDGSTIDVDGCLWNARWDGGVILRITPDGKVDRVITMPVKRPTSCIFGGPNLDVLYVTSARNGLTAEQLAQAPLSGSVFAIPGLGQGMPVPAMKT